LQKEVIDEYQLDGVKFSDHICLVEPKFPKSKTPAKRSSMGKGKSSRRTQEDLEIIREAKQMSKESSKNKQKDISTKGLSSFCCRVSEMCCDVTVLCCDVTVLCCDVTVLWCDVTVLCCDVTH